MEGVGLLIAVLAAVVVGAAVGFWIANRPAAGLKQERDELRAEIETARQESEGWRTRFNEAIINLAGEAEKTKRLNDVEARLAAEREAAGNLRAEVAAYQRGEAERERAYQEQLAQLKQLEGRMEARFGELAGKAVETAHDQFIKRAEEKLGATGAQNEAKLKQLLQPVETTLKRYEEGLHRVEKERVDSYAGLREAVELVRSGQGQVRDETRNLVNALRSAPKTRGRWGEQSLRNVLVQSGLVEGIDFNMEVSVTTDDGRLRPDVVVNLPSDRKLIIDAKCSLNAFLEACDEVDEDKRKACFRAHVASIQRHAQQLGSKAYWSQFGEAADYVIMYIPGEHFLTAALEEDPEIWEKAFKDRVLLATPTNLVAIARTVASVWKQEKLREGAEEIAALGKELHSRLATMAEHMARMGRNIGLANDAYNKMVGSFETQVFTQARRFEGLGAGSSKELAFTPMVEASPRPLTKLAPPSNDDPPQIAAE